MHTMTVSVVCFLYADLPTLALEKFPKIFSLCMENIWYIQEHEMSRNITVWIANFRGMIMMYMHGMHIMSRFYSSILLLLCKTT